MKHRSENLERVNWVGVIRVILENHPNDVVSESLIKDLAINFRERCQSVWSGAISGFQSSIDRHADADLIRPLSDDYYAGYERACFDIKAHIEEQIRDANHPDRRDTKPMSFFTVFMGSLLVQIDHIIEDARDKQYLEKAGQQVSE